ncbi:hypothetical protein ACGFSI_02855 [Streptomyces virginiae]|uniref:hypothetical protein n=1 Tax=Streptomyces virginiae TaxID=1961 RepID=UPI00370FE8B2
MEVFAPGALSAHGIQEPTRKLGTGNVLEVDFVIGLRETDYALGVAEEAIHEHSDEPGPDWAYWVDLDEIAIMTGRCWAELHRPLRGIPALEDALARYDDTRARDKALYLSWLAAAYLDAG